MIDVYVKMVRVVLFFLRMLKNVVTDGEMVLQYLAEQDEAQ